MATKPNRQIDIEIGDKLRARLQKCFEDYKALLPPNALPHAAVGYRIALCSEQMRMNKLAVDNEQP